MVKFSRSRAASCSLDGEFFARFSVCGSSKKTRVCGCRHRFAIAHSVVQPALLGGIPRFEVFEIMGSAIAARVKIRTGVPAAPSAFKGRHYVLSNETLILPFCFACTVPALNLR